MIKKLAIKTIKSKYILWPAVVMFFVFASIVIRYASIPDKTIFPNAEHYICNSYTDEIIGGNTVVNDEIISDSIAQIKFSIGLAIASPYAGLSIYPQKTEFIDVSSYNQINISIAGKNMERVSIALHAPYQDSDVEEAIYHKYLNVSESKAIYQIPLKDLKLPEWWMDVHQMVGSEDYRPDLNKITYVAVNSAYMPDFQTEKTIAVYSISLSRNVSRLIVIFCFVFLSTILLLYVILFLVYKKKEKTTEVTVSYKPVNIKDNVNKSIDCIAYINTHYSSCELSLSIIARETGLPERQIANTINQKFKCNFKSYLNQIRIAESKRLLKETNLGMGEIAYKVGFNTQSHFNRVFKSLEGINPSDFKTTDS